MASLLDERPAVHAGAGRQELSRSAVLLDAQPLLLEMLDRLLAKAGVATVSKHTTAEGALEAVREHRPDLLLLDLRDIDGVRSITEARELVPGLKTIVLVDPGDDTVLGAAFAAGATVAISRAARPDDLALAVRQAFEPSIYLAHALRVGQAPVRVDARRGGLTKREQEILQLVAEGHSNGRVARLLWVTEQTVKFHLSNTYRKLDVSNRTEASRWAQRNGLLSEAPAS
jgi:DNA-binding NarL/FixJ family response regulator